MTTPACWQRRGCDREMRSRCPHARDSRDSGQGLCPLQCNYAVCTRPQHHQASGLDLLDSAADRSQALMETCWYCEYFLRQAPRLHPDRCTEMTSTRG